MQVLDPTPPGEAPGRHRQAGCLQLHRPPGPVVHVLIPAHDEAASIARTLVSLGEQTLPLENVLVVADKCQDDTATIAHAYGAEVIETIGNTHMKAGALNQGLDYLLPRIQPEDFVLVMDADSRLEPGFVNAALQHLTADPQVGAVCAVFAGEPGRPGIIHTVQRSEYARFARLTSRHGCKAQVLSGVATVFPVSVLCEIRQGREDGRLPSAPGIYDVTAATEDIEMTFAVQALGYRPLAPAECVAYTDTMDNWLALARQRIRWQRGMLDALRLYGVDRRTFKYARRLTVMYIGSLLTPLYLVLIALTLGFTHHLGYDPVWLAIIPFFCFERWWTVRHLSRKEGIIAALLLPEWLYDNWRAVVYWIALVRWIRRTERVWIPT